MFGHYLALALASFRRHKALTALMVIAIAMGVCASTATLTIYLGMSGDPLPGRSHQLFRVQLDAMDGSGFVPGAEPLENLTRNDAEILLREARGVRQAAMSGGLVTTASAPNDPVQREPAVTGARFTTPDFFAMFGVPFLHGQGWSVADEAALARVVVLTRQAAEKLFDRADVVGRSLMLNDREFRVVGVLADWQPVPYFFDPSLGGYRSTEGLFVPLRTALDLRFATIGSTRCWGDNEGIDRRGEAARCAWLQFWVQLDTPAQVQAYRQVLADHAVRQKAAGRYTRPPNARLRDVMQWLDAARVVPSDVKLQVWLALGFLVVCLVNTVGLLLAKFMRRSAEVGVRRALGASRRAIFTQFLVEAGTVGAVGCGLGFGLAQFGLWLARQSPDSAGKLVALDVPMLAATLAAAFAATLLAGLLPAWRACQVTPALQLKAQ